MALAWLLSLSRQAEPDISRTSQIGVVDFTSDCAFTFIRTECSSREVVLKPIWIGGKGTESRAGLQQ